METRGRRSQEVAPFVVWPLSSSDRRHVVVCCSKSANSCSSVMRVIISN